MSLIRSAFVAAVMAACCYALAQDSEKDTERPPTIKPARAALSFEVVPSSSGDVTDIHVEWVYEGKPAILIVMLDTTSMYQRPARFQLAGLLYGSVAFKTISESGRETLRIRNDLLPKMGGEYVESLSLEVFISGSMKVWLCDGSLKGCRFQQHYAKLRPQDCSPRFSQLCGRGQELLSVFEEVRRHEVDNNGFGIRSSIGSPTMTSVLRDVLVIKKK